MGARWSTPSGQQWTIGRGSHRATIVQVGGGLREYTVDGTPMVEPYPETAVCPKSAGQVLAPWPNRLGDGRYEFGGTTYQLPLNEVPRRNATHGLVRWLPWQRTDQTPESVEVTCELTPQPGYPYALGLSTRWSVGPDGLRAEHTVVNLGNADAPFGFGAHPYLRVADESLDALELHLPLTERLLVDDRLLPTGREAVAGTPYDFTGPRVIGTTEFDTAFTGAQRDADGLLRLRLGIAGGPGVELWQDEQFGWTQVYSGTGPAGRARATLAVEPMTCPPDAFRTGDGLITLPPGGRWQGSWGIAPFG